MTLTDRHLARAQPAANASSFHDSSSAAFEPNWPSLQSPELVVAASCRGQGSKVTHVSGNRRPRRRLSGSHASVARKAAARVCLLVTVFARVVLPSGYSMRILHKLFHNRFISFPTVKESLLSLWPFGAGKALCLPFRPCVGCSPQKQNTFKLAFI